MASKDPQTLRATIRNMNIFLVASLLVTLTICIIYLVRGKSLVENLDSVLISLIVPLGALLAGWRARRQLKAVEEVS